MHFSPYLNFDGNCAEAMTFYKSVFGGKLDVLRYRDAPQMPAPPSAGDRVMHAHLDVGGKSLMASDTMPGQPYGGMSNFGVALAYDSVAEAKRVFEALSAGGKVGMPMEPTFWAEVFGMVTDRFGTPWLVNGPMIKMM